MDLLPNLVINLLEGVAVRHGKDKHRCVVAGVITRVTEQKMLVGRVAACLNKLVLDLAESAIVMRVDDIAMLAVAIPLLFVYLLGTLIYYRHRHPELDEQKALDVVREHAMKMEAGEDGDDDKNVESIGKKE